MVSGFHKHPGNLDLDLTLNPDLHLVLGLNLGLDLNLDLHLWNLNKSDVDRIFQLIFHSAVYLARQGENWGICS